MPAFGCAVTLTRHERDPLNGPDAAAAGLLLEETKTADIVDSHVVICARRAGQVVLTSDPEDIGRT